MKKPSIKTIIMGKNGVYSSKRVCGFFLVFVSIVFACLGNNEYAETCIYAGAGLISAGVLEKKERDNSTDEMG
jgi:hypothetical protein